MEPVSIFLLAIAGIFIIGIAGEMVFERTGVPDVIWLILVGIVIGRGIEHTQLERIAPYFGAITLVIILFDGGSELRLVELRQAAPRSALLAFLGFSLSVAVLAPVTMLAVKAGLLPASFTWLHCIMVGTILGGSSSVVIMPALRMAGLAPRISNLVNLESALTDVLCVVATGACIRIASPLTGAGGEHPAVTLGKSFGIGLVIGLVAGLLALLVLRRLKKSHYAFPLILGFLLVLYVLIDELGGSAALGILAVAVMIGNAPSLSKAVGLARTAQLGRSVANVHDQFAFIVKSFFFVFIGAMLSPPWSLIGLGIGLGVLMLVARIPAVLGATLGSGLSKPARGLVTVSMPRGMAAGVLAMMPAQAQVPDTQQLPVMVFSAVFTSIVIFAVGFPVLRRRLGGEDLAPKTDKPAVRHAAADASMSLAADESLIGAALGEEARAAAEGQPAVPDDAEERVSEPAPRAGLAVDLPSGPADATIVDPDVGPPPAEEV